MQQEKYIFINIKYFFASLFTCTKFYKFAMIYPEMKKILIYIASLLVCTGIADAGVRDGGDNISRTGNGQQSRVSTVPKRTNADSKRTTLTSRGASNTRQTGIRQPAPTQRNVNARSAIQQTPKQTTPGVIARATSTTETLPETRTGAAYEQCKTAYFTCMDQFCTLKSDDYRRCSCNDRVFDMIELRNTLQDAGNQLKTFNENLEIVGMTYAQASAMHQESEGESALTSDKSASKALLQAIMNSIRGTDTNVGGKYADLNSINISFDTANAFGITDSGQVIASYNGQALYQAVYPQCRQAVKDVCNDASLQRAITAYLMAIEQDCNTVQTAIESTQKQLKSAIREGSAMLDLARVENRQKHNSSDITTCINEIEIAIQSEEVCGKNYHKCLDNGEYIDISTGAPIAGVKDFYNLATLLTFSDGVDAMNQQLSKISNNRNFVTNFENRVKKFAEPALDKCVENADFAWSEYLDKAMLDIHYAQKSKVNEIKQGCFDFVSSCYINSDKAITNAMAVLTGNNNIVIKPGQITLSSQMCTDYIESCNNLFAADIIKEYINKQTETDTLTACRAVVQQCFDKYGGTNYENFYYPYSGLFLPGNAAEWFTLYTYTYNTKDKKIERTITSPCAKQLADISACQDIIEQAFGGFDNAPVAQNNEMFEFDSDSSTRKYGLIESTGDTPVDKDDFSVRYLRSTGIATEVYNQILSVLTTQCTNLQGRFVEHQFITGNYLNSNKCIYSPDSSAYTSIIDTYGIQKANNKLYENMCPRDYGLSVDIDSWGICSCWENGARRSQNSKTTKCTAVYYDNTNKKWQDGVGLSSENQVCAHINASDNCTDATGNILSQPYLPIGIYTKTSDGN